MPPATILSPPSPPKPSFLHRKTTISAKAPETSPAALWRPRRANPRLPVALLPCPLGPLGGLGHSWGGAWRLWAASGVPLRSLGHLPDVAGRLQDAPGPPKKHFRWLQGPPGRSLGRFPRTFFCRKCVRCLELCPQPDATCACRRGCITSDEASSCSIQATHSPLTQSKTKQLQMHHQAAAAKR